MTLKNKDLDLLIEVENTLGNIYNFNEHNEITRRVWTLVERLIVERDKYNKKNTMRINEKRSINKNYARPKNKGGEK